MLARYGLNESEARKRGVRGYLKTSDDYGANLLLDRGLAESIPPHPGVILPDPDRDRVALTESGVALARLFMARNEPPAWLRDLNDESGG